MKIIITSLVTALIALLILLLVGWKALGWFIVALIVSALVFIGMIPLTMFIVNSEQNEEISSLEKRIKEKERQGYTEDELEDLKKKLYFLRGTHE